MAWIDGVRRMVSQEMKLVSDDEYVESYPYRLLKPMKKGTLCLMCNNKATSRHHIIPKSVWTPGDKKHTVPLCNYCHVHLHKHFSNRVLREKYNKTHKLKTSMR